jgi:hypothetical protein
MPMTEINNAPGDAQQAQSRQLPMHRISSPEVKRFEDLFSVWTDMKRLRDCLAEWTQTPEQYKGAIFSAGLIIYRRCFNSGVRGGLHASDVASLGIDGATDAHTYLMNQANKLVAHSVNPFESTLAGVTIDGEKITGIGVQCIRFSHHEEEDIRQWAMLAELLIRKVLQPRIKKAEDAAIECARKTPIAALLKAPLLGHTIPSPADAGKARN